MKKIYTAALLAAFVYATPVLAQNNRQEPVQASMEGHIFKPAKREASAENVKNLKVPAGFTVTKFADNLNKPRMMAVHTDGTIYVTDRDSGTVTMLQDKNQDGKAEIKKQLAKKENMHGVAINQGKLYLTTVKEVYRADIISDGTIGELQALIKDLPDGGQHPNRTVYFGPDGMMYLTIGSTCNACDEPNKENATILQAKADGNSRRVYAKGLRNTIGLDWHPETKKLYGMDHGIDWLGDDDQKEELNVIEDGADYGWPFIYADGKHNPADQPKNMSYEAYAAKSTMPLLLYDAHSAPMDMKFYTGSQFPEEYRNDAFVTLHGSWNRSQAVGYKVVRVRFENGQPAKIEDFLTGFLLENGKSQFGRVVGLAQHTDGSLLVSDDENGVIYRIAYQQPVQKNKPGKKKR